MYIDSHCHLDHLDLAPYGGSLDAALDAARSVGVAGFLLIGIDLYKFEQLLQIRHRYADVWMSIGTHPLHPEQMPDAALLAECAAHPSALAVGETGLDYHYAPETKELQMESFARHMQLAADLNKPVIIHSRAAKQDTLDLMADHRGSVRGVLHCFTEDWDMAEQAVDMGYYISFSGIVTFRNADALRQVAAQVPDHRLLIETDAPWLAPVPHRGRQNEPRYLPEVAATLAAVRGTNPAHIGALTTANFHQLFATGVCSA